MDEIGICEYFALASNSGINLRQHGVLQNMWLFETLTPHFAFALRSKHGVILNTLAEVLQVRPSYIVMIISGCYCERSTTDVWGGGVGPLIDMSLAPHVIPCSGRERHAARAKRPPWPAAWQAADVGRAQFSCDVCNRSFRAGERPTSIVLPVSCVRARA